MSVRPSGWTQRTVARQVEEWSEALKESNICSDYIMGAARAELGLFFQKSALSVSN